MNTNNNKNRNTNNNINRTTKPSNRTNFTPRKSEKAKSGINYKFVITQVAIILVLSVVISLLLFLPGNKSLISGIATPPQALAQSSYVDSMSKVDNSFMITSLSTEIDSKSAILTDLASGEVLAQKFPDEKVYPASLTKIMTATLVLEHFNDLQQEIEMPSDMYVYLLEQNASQAGFLAGEKVKIIDLLYGVLLPSGADACLALARTVAGTEQNFAKQMTEKAKELGAENTNFVNSTGLHDDNHYSTVRDLSCILAYALKNETFKTIFTTERYTTSPTNKHTKGLTLTNTTFKAFERAKIENVYVKGGKTGFTGEACLCLASLAMREGREYTLVTVGAGSSTSSRGTQHVQDADLIYNSIDKYLK